MNFHLGLDQFAFRQFDDPNYIGTQIRDWSKQAFMETLHQIIQQNDTCFVDGYACFCKHLFLPNFVKAFPGEIELIPEVIPLIRCDYKQRTLHELPVLERWVNASDLNVRGISLKPASTLDVIVYSQQQLNKEAEATAQKVNTFLHDASLGVPEYSIISIKAQNASHELPMSPITMMRNALIQEGGSGISLDREKYLDSVNYWSNHCNVNYQ